MYSSKFYISLRDIFFFLDKNYFCFTVSFEIRTLWAFSHWAVWYAPMFVFLESLPHVEVVRPNLPSLPLQLLSIAQNVGAFEFLVISQRVFFKAAL